MKEKKINCKFTQEMLDDLKKVKSLEEKIIMEMKLEKRNETIKKILKDK